jgi:hypothetical protein
VQHRQVLGGHRAGRDVGVVDDRPDGLAALAGRLDGADLGLDAPFDDGEDLLDGAPRRRDAGPDPLLAARRGPVTRPCGR